MKDEQMNTFLGRTMGRIMYGLAVSSAVMTAACSNDTLGDRKAINLTYTLQGVVSDAVTGARIGGDDLELYIVEGDDIRGPSRLNDDVTDPLAGEYAFSGIPVDFTAGNKTYKVV